MSRAHWRWLAIAGVTFTLACATLARVFAGAPDRVAVPHAKHQAAQVDCLACHEDIFETAVLGKSTLPKEAKCLECHRKEKESGNCGFCHTRPDAPKTWERRERHLVMSHERHLELKEINEKCDVCHTKLPEPGDVERVSPPMAACTGCHPHRQQFAAGDCERCHLDLSRYGLRPITAFSHEGDYLHQHARDARSRPAACSTCHEQRYCADCHAPTVAMSIERLFPERVDRQYIHRGDYESRHSYEARADGALCLRCHGTSFCEDCHTRRGLTSAGTRPGNPHPAGYADPNAPVFHGRDARRDIVSCAACHDQGAQSNCVECHRVGSFGGNPHPPAWLSRHRHEEINANAMCLACHL